MKKCKNNKWMIWGCVAPIFLFIALKLFFPSFAYLAFLGLLVCPISMAFMMYFMGKNKKTEEDHSNKSTESCH